MLKDFINKGTYGSVCLYQHPKEKKYYAIKLENSKKNSNSSTIEATILRKLKREFDT